MPGTVLPGVLNESPQEHLQVPRDDPRWQQTLIPQVPDLGNHEAPAHAPDVNVLEQTLSRPHGYNSPEQIQNLWSPQLDARLLRLDTPPAALSPPETAAHSDLHADAETWPAWLDPFFRSDGGAGHGNMH
jgi:hypothetical protein